MEVNLSDFRTNVFSQNGEDGVIAKLFEVAGIKTGYLVEFGAWDGITYSNARHHYLTNPDFRLLMIEPDKDRYAQLERNYPERKVILMNAEIKSGDEFPNLTDVFSMNPLSNVALLSIDVDGEDLNIWKSLQTDIYRPKIVIIEFSKWQEEEALSELEQCFAYRGYNLVCVTGNFIFVDSRLGIKSPFGIHELIRRSGLPEYDQYFGFIDTDKVNERNALKEQEKDIFCRLASPQPIEFEEPKAVQ